MIWFKKTTLDEFQISSTYTREGQVKTARAFGAGNYITRYANGGIQD